MDEIPLNDGLKKLQPLMENLFRLTGVGVSLHDAAGGVLLEVGQPAVCKELYSQYPDLFSNCAENHAGNKAGLKVNGYDFYKCGNGLWHGWYKIYRDEQQIGTLYFQQFLYEDEEYTLKRGDGQTALNRIKSDKSIRKFIDQIPRFKEESILTIANLYAELVNTFLRLHPIGSSGELADKDIRFRSIFENAIAGIAFTDGSGKIILCNAAYEEIVGYTLEELKNLTFYDITHSDDLREERRLLNDALGKTSRAYNFEKRYRKKDGSLVWVHISVSIICDEKNLPAYFVKVVHDISIRKEAETELKKLLHFNEALIQTSPVCITVTNEKGEIIFANPRTEEKLGIKKEEITRRTYNSPDWKITDFEGRPFPEEELPFFRVRKEMKPVYGIKHAIEKPDGSRIFLSVNASPQFDPDGNFTGMLATLEDITQSVVAERKETADSGFRKAIIDHAADGLCVCSRTDEFPFMKFTVWNNRMTTITGYTLEEINQLGWFQSLFPDPAIQNQAMERMELMRAGVNIEREEWEIVTKSGEKRIISISASVLIPDSDASQLLAVITDITDVKESEIALRETNEQLTESNTSKDKFFSILAHDLKNPFGAIVGVSDLMDEAIAENDMEQVKYYSTVLNRAARKSYELLVNLLEWSRIQNKKIEFQPAWIDLYQAISDSVEAHVDQAAQKKLRILNVVEEGLLAFADKNMMQTVIRNLVNNAIKYSKPEGEIRFSSETGNDEIIVCVEDHGVGIPDEILPHLFRIDGNVTTSGTSNEEGTGLGLMLCKEFLDFHKGTIWAESEIGNGTRFRFSIPRKKIGEKESEFPDPVNDAEVNSIVLIAEDEEINFLLLKALLRNLNCRILRAHNGSEAVDLVAANPNLDLILMDIKMPVMDGVTAANKIREFRPDIPIVAQTAYEVTAETKALFQGYLTKPIDKSTLFRTIGKYLCH
jgi:PAS domain S-box-containing protein